MVFAETQLRQWWERRSDDERARLKQAAEKRQLDPETVQLLAHIGLAGPKWEMQPDWDWSWPEDVRAFIAAQ
jgi:hypothetical protein